MRDSLIVALDTDAHGALTIARSLQGSVRYLKVGMTLFYAEGPEIVARIKDLGFDVFVDLKLHDIPHQVRGAAREISRLGASMFTVHAAGGMEMMQAAVEGACEGSEGCGVDTPDVIAVTVLTSLGAAGLAATGVRTAPAEHAALLADLARESGVQGVVCSPHEARAMRSLLGREALVVTPGVRPPGADAGDQARVATPGEAISNGASHIVVGRPITGAADPAAAVAALLETMEVRP
jgi:orotidine-5'-phosphate decarboxylase